MSLLYAVFQYSLGRFPAAVIDVVQVLGANLDMANRKQSLANAVNTTMMTNHIHLSLIGA